jgi:hypothetical protein
MLKKLYIEEYLLTDTNKSKSNLFDWLACVFYNKPNNNLILLKNSKVAFSDFIIKFEYFNQYLYSYSYKVCYKNCMFSYLVEEYYMGDLDYYLLLNNNLQNKTHLDDMYEILTKKLIYV